MLRTKAKTGSGSGGGKAKDPLQDLAQSMIDADVKAQVEDDLTMLLNGSSKAATKEFIRKPQYTAEAMVQLFLDHPDWTHAQFADYFGYRASWFAGVLISNNLQAALDKRREEVAAVNPMLAGTMAEMFQAATVQAMSLLQVRMEDPKATNDLLLDVAKIGVRALGLGTAANAAPPPPPPHTIHDLASNLLQSNPPEQSSTPAPDMTIDVMLHDISDRVAPGAEE